MTDRTKKPSRHRSALDAHDWDKERYVTLREVAEMSPYMRLRFTGWHQEPDTDRLLNPRLMAVD